MATSDGQSNAEALSFWVANLLPMPQGQRVALSRMTSSVERLQVRLHDTAAALRPARCAGLLHLPLPAVTEPVSKPGCQRAGGAQPHAPGPQHRLSAHVMSTNLWQPRLWQLRRCFAKPILCSRLLQCA